MSRSAFRVLATAGFLFAPSLALAHPGHVGDVGFVDGLIHPLSGLDHLLAMVAVGLLAAQLGGRALWALPSTFVSVMALGGLAGASAMPPPFVEAAMELSVLVFGLAIVARLNLPALPAVALVGAFAIFHGYAHGLEMPAAASGPPFGLGFMLATAMLHGLGIALGLSLGRIEAFAGRRAVQTCGALIAAGGFGLVTGFV
jgi:urease accessory protein